MRLVHYTDSPLPELEPRSSRGSLDAFHKPRGLWVSDDDCENNWRTWCLGESFNLERLTHVYDVEITQGANVVILRSPEDIDGFTSKWRAQRESYWYGQRIRWPDVQDHYQGIIITPYIWERRLHDDTTWYYGWDCASGCIWDPAAIASVTLREIVQAPEPAF